MKCDTFLIIKYTSLIFPQKDKTRTSLSMAALCMNVCWHWKSY